MNENETAIPTRRVSAATGRRPLSPRRIAARWAAVSLGATAVCAACCFALDPVETGVVAAMAAISAPLSLLVGARRSERTTRRERAEHEVLIVGRNRRTVDYLTSIRKSERVVNVMGILDSARATGADAVEPCPSDAYELDGEPIPYLGDHTQLDRALAGTPVDEVVITLPIKSCYDAITHCLKVCQEAGIPASLSAELFELERPCPNQVECQNGGARLCYRRTRWPRWQQVLKRTVDILGALTAIAIFGIPMLFIAIAIKLTSRGPLLYWQDRVGEHGKVFRFPKFRSMVVNADALKEQLAHLNEQAGPVFKMKRDPRVTRVGRFIRKHSLDELPQLFCVLFGSMSLVGPRPPIPAEVEKYEWWQRRRLSVKPGLTCLWQCSGRNDIQFDEWMRLDLRYIDEWSLWLDTKLLLKTIPTVIRGSGV